MVKDHLLGREMEEILVEVVDGGERPRARREAQVALWVAAGWRRHVFLVAKMLVELAGVAGRRGPEGVARDERTGRRSAHGSRAWLPGLSLREYKGAKRCTESSEMGSVGLRWRGVPCVS